MLLFSHSDLLQNRNMLISGQEHGLWLCSDAVRSHTGLTWVGHVESSPGTGVSSFSGPPIITGTLCTASSTTSHRLVTQAMLDFLQ